MTAMRYFCFALLFVLAGCGADPASMGITGAGMAPPPRDPGAETTGITGAPSVGTQYAPSVGPNTGAGKFWGYN